MPYMDSICHDETPKISVQIPLGRRWCHLGKNGDSACWEWRKGELQGLFGLDLFKVMFYFVPW